MKFQIEMAADELNELAGIANELHEPMSKTGADIIREYMRRRTQRAIDGATVSPIERDWSGEEEDKAWAHLQKPPRN